MTDDRFERVAAAVEYDSGLAIQMARYSHEDVRWLVGLVRELTEQRDELVAQSAEGELAEECDNCGAASVIVAFIGEDGERLCIKCSAAEREELWEALENLHPELGRLRTDNNIMRNTLASKNPNFDVDAIRVQCEQRGAADQRADKAEGVVRCVRSLATTVAALQDPDPDTHDRDVSWLALLAALEGNE